MFSRFPRDEALEKEDMIDVMKKRKKTTTTAQQAPALPYAKAVGRPGTGSSLTDRSLHHKTEVTIGSIVSRLSTFSNLEPFQ